MSISLFLPLLKSLSDYEQSRESFRKRLDTWCSPLDELKPVEGHAFAEELIVCLKEEGPERDSCVENLLSKPYATESAERCLLGCQKYAKPIYQQSCLSHCRKTSRLDPFEDFQHVTELCHSFYDLLRASDEDSIIVREELAKKCAYTSSIMPICLAISKTSTADLLEYAVTLSESEFCARLGFQ